MMRGRRVSASASAASTTAAACVAARRARCRWPMKKVMSPPRAASRDATRATRVPASPATRPPRRETILPSVSGPGTRRSLGGRLARLEGLDHLVGDVDARAREHGVLEDDVVLFLLGDLPDHAVGLLHHLRQLFVAALVEVLAELALLALELALQVAELALLVAALRLGHGHRVLVQVLLHALELVGEPRQLLVALLELGLDLLLRALRRDGVAQDALRVDEGELARERRRRGLVLR